MSWDKINRRRFVRIKFPFTIHLYFPQESPIAAYTENISEGGLRVTIRRELKLSSVVDLEIYVKLRPVRCKGKIAWIKKWESNYLEGEVFYDIGLEFQGLTPGTKSAIKERLDRIVEERRKKAQTGL